MDETEPYEAPHPVVPHPLWLGGILLFGAVLLGLDGHWSLAALFLLASAAACVGAVVRSRARGRDAPNAPPQD